MIMSESRKNHDIVENLKNHSIYVRSDDKDRDFELYVFIDPAKQEDRTDFLQELYRELMNNNENGEKFCVIGHQWELERWLGDKNLSESPELCTPLNWLKVAIEQYPYRLFVVIDPLIPKEEGGWRDELGFTPLDDEFWFSEKDYSSVEARNESPHVWKRSKFLYKRICWLSRDEFSRQFREYEKIKNSENYTFRIISIDSRKDLSWESYIKLWLYFKWIVHLCKKVRRIQSNYLRIHFYKLGSTSAEERKNPPYYSDSLPQKLRLKEPELEKEMLLLDFQNETLDISTDNSKYISCPVILYRRHANTFRYYGKDDWRPEYGDYRNVFYGESLAGGLTYWTSFIDAVSNLSKVRSIRFILSLIEQALLRIYLVDERVQEWYTFLSQEIAGDLVQQRLFVSYLEDPLKFNQRGEPEHNLYAVVTTEGQTVDAFFSNKDFFSMITGNHLIDNKQDILIIHQGILDKWESNTATLFGKILKWKDTVPLLVITSGRGTPVNLPQGAKFLPFSAVESCILGTYFEKLTLARQILSLKI